jgi:hypothetical protein
MGSNIQPLLRRTMPDPALTPQRFCKAFVAALVLEGERVLEPKLPRVRRGFRRVIDVLESQVTTESAKGASTWFKQLVRLRNELYPSNNGTFDSMEMTLRDLQTSSVSCPNPDYDYISFDISRVFAESILGALSDPERLLVKEAAKAFGGGIAQSGAAV